MIALLMINQILISMRKEGRKALLAKDQPQDLDQSLWELRSCLIQIS